MKIIKKLSLFLPLVCFVLIVNYFGDVNMQFYKYGTIEEICSAFSDGYNVRSEVVDNINKRQLAKVNTMYNHPEAIMLGSSRTMSISGSLLGEESYYNDSVGYAVLEDYMAILELYAETELPSRIYIGPDVWIFNSNNKDTGVKQSEFWRYETSKWKKRIGYSDSVSELDKYQKYQDLFSLAYFQDSLKVLFDGVETTKQTDTDVSHGSIYTHEGIYLNSSENNAIADKEDINKSMNDLLNSKCYDYLELDSEKIKMFELTIDYLQSCNVEIVLLLIPYHPYSVEFFNERLPVYFEFEDYMLDLAKRKKLRIYGSMNPEYINADGEQFYPDGVHVRDPLVFETILKNER